MHLHGSSDTSRVLRLSLAATFIYIVVTLVAGLEARSLALISEAGHNASDFLALLLSWVAVFFQERPPTASKTFGYHRAGVLAAFINAAMLTLIAVGIFYEAYERLRNPITVHPQVMIYVAVAGVVMNGAIAYFLHRSGRDVNIRSALIHELGDTASTAAVIVGGWAIMVTGETWIDPVLSLGIGGLILWSSIGILRESMNILLEGTPRGIDLNKVAQAIAVTPGVLDVHDLHVWSIGSEVHALACHVLIADIPPSESERILLEINRTLREQFQIFHTTLQFEHAGCEILHGCAMPLPHSHAHPSRRT